MKEQIRETVLSCGADLCGIANIDRFDDFPAGFKPTDIDRGCKSVISFAVALPRGLTKINPRLIYNHFNSISCFETDRIAFQSAKKIEDGFGCIAIPMPCDIPYEYWDSDQMEGRGLLSMRHLAVQAGLGSIGKNNLLINQRFGNMVTLGAILTDLELPSDALSENMCMDSCRKCVEACPVNALGNGCVNQRLCREHTFGKTERGFDTVECNRCRVVCPMNDVNIRKHTV